MIHARKTKLFSDPAQWHNLVMRMYLTMAASMSLLMAYPAMAADWVVLRAKSAKSPGLAYDRASLRRDGSRITIWVRYQYYTPRKGVSEARDQTRYDCENRTTTGLFVAEYDVDGGVLDSGDTGNARAKPIIPGSYAERVFEAVCGTRA